MRTRLQITCARLRPLRAAAGEVEQRGLKRVRESLNRLQSALRKPYADWLDEAYYVVDLREVRDGTAAPLTGSQLIDQYGRDISQVIRPGSERGHPPTAPATPTRAGWLHIAAGGLPIRRRLNNG